jgi:hypothetical protein
VAALAATTPPAHAKIAVEKKPARPARRAAKRKDDAAPAADNRPKFGDE